MRVALGVDIGGTNVKLAWVDESGAVTGARSVPTPDGGAPQALVDAIAETARSMRPECPATALGAGVGVAGFLDPARSAMVYNANLPALAGFPLRAALEERFATPCVLEVDSNASALAEYAFGAGRGAQRLLGITIGTGLGGGVIVNGQLLRYCGECAGDIGHVIVQPGGRRCSCGAFGCLEAYVCAGALEEATGRTPRAAIEAAAAGEPAARRAIAGMGEMLGVGLASLAHLFAPDRIVVGGGVAAAGEALLEPARAAFRAAGSPHFTSAATIVQAAFKGHEGVAGAAAAFFLANASTR